MTSHLARAFVLLGSVAALPALAEPLQEQVIVTATRLPTPGQSLPLSWSGLPASDIEFTGHIHVNELLQQVSGAWISRGNGQESLTALRSPVLTGAGSCGAFYMASDGISLRAPGFCNVNQLFDANTEQAGAVEVIKGPATALYGSSAMHGVINVLSAASPSETEQALALEAGPYDYYRARYRYGTTRGAHGWSLNVNGSHDGGYKDDSGYDQQKLTLRHDYSGRRWQISSALDLANLNQETAGFIQGERAYEDEDLKDTNPNPEAYRDARSLRFYTSAERQLDERNRLSVTPYLRSNDMTFLMHFLPWQPVEENGHDSLGLKVNLYTDDGPWHWVNGVDFDFTDGWLKETQARPFSPNQPAGVHYDYQVDALMAAAFSQLHYEAGERWDLHAGLRLEYNRYDYDNRTGDGSPCTPAASACRFYRPADREDSFTDYALNLGASYRLRQGTHAYMRLAQGFRAPQVAELYRLQSGQQVADLDSEELRNLELGLRGSGDAWQYSVAAFLMHKREVIFQDADRQNVSGAKTRHYGLELEADYRFAEHWSLDVDLSLARHQYDSAAQLLGASGDIEGNDIDTAPRVFGSARLSRELPAWRSRAGLEWVYMGSYYLEPDNEHEYDGHSLLNLRLQGQLNDTVALSLRLTNLLDEDYAERADFGFGNYRYFVGQPRGAYVELTFSP